MGDGSQARDRAAADLSSGKGNCGKNQTNDYTNPAAGGILKPKAPVTDVPVSTAPVSNRTALFGAADTPDLTLTAKKLEQMGDLYWWIMLIQKVQTC